MKIKINKKIFALSLFIIIAIAGYFVGDKVWAAGEIATDDVLVTLTVDEGISITTGTDVTMSPNISVSANSSIGSSSWNVKTNSHAGYTLAVKADADPALVSATNNFTDYTEAVLGTPELWSVDTGTYEFGYSAYGTDTLDATWGALDTCGVAGVPGGNKYVGTQTTDKTIATRSVPTLPAGVTTTICFAAEQKDVYAPSGTYTTTITATATTL